MRRHAAAANDSEVAAAIDIAPRDASVPLAMAPEPCDDALGLAPARLAPNATDRRYRCEICASRYRVLLEERFSCAGERVFGWSSACHVFEIAALVAFFYFVLAVAPALGGALTLWSRVAASASAGARATLWCLLLVALVVSLVTLRRICRSMRSANSVVSIVPSGVQT